MVNPVALLLATQTAGYRYRQYQALDDFDNRVLQGLGIAVPEDPRALSRGEILMLFEKVVETRDAPPGVHLPDLAALGSKLAKVTGVLPAGLFMNKIYTYDVHWVKLDNSLPPYFFRAIITDPEAIQKLAVRWVSHPYSLADRAIIAAGFTAGVLTWRNLHHGNLVPFLGADIRHEETAQRVSMPTNVWDKPTVVCTISQYMPEGHILWYLSKLAALKPKRKARKPISIPTLLLDIATGLEFLYSKGVLYGIFTPEDVGIDGQGHARLTDRVHSLSILNLQSSRDPSQQPPSIRYVAPEILKQETYVEDAPALDMKAVNIFSFASVCLAVYTLNDPFPDEHNTMRVRIHLRSGQRPARPKVEQCPFGAPSDGLWQLLEKCWAANPEERPILAEVMHQLRTDAQDTAR